MISKELAQALEFAKTLRDDQVIDFLMEQSPELEVLFEAWSKQEAV
jgi:hypothetical protein